MLIQPKVGVQVRVWSSKQFFGTGLVGPGSDSYPSRAASELSSYYMTQEYDQAMRLSHTLDQDEHTADLDLGIASGELLFSILIG